MNPVSLTHIRDLQADQIQNFLSLSTQIKKNPSQFSHILKGKTILQFFVENSTRTRMSFEAATRKLGGTNVVFAPGSSSLSKGETLLDTVATIRQYGVDAVVMRHSSGGAPEWVSNALQIPIINAGDGQHEHPTQALLDCFTLMEHWGAQGKELFQGKTVMIIGDILHSRVARSNIHALTRLGAHVILCAPQTLLPSRLDLFPNVEVIYRPEAALARVDAVMCLRIQFERQNQNFQHLPSAKEYRHFWGLTLERAAQLKAAAVILHPGPMNRGVEIDPEVADSESSLILKQVENGVFVRMAVLGSVLQCF